MDKPALLWLLFQLGCANSGQILSYQKMLGQLQVAGNTVASGDSDQLNAAWRHNLSCDIPLQAAGNVLVFKLAIQKVVPEYQPYLAARSAAGKI